MEKDRKIQIIKAAVKRFTKHGVSKTTLDEVARDLRIGKATIYHYFESKEDLYFETLNYRTNEYFEEIKNIFNNEDITIKERFLEYFHYKENLHEKFQLIYELVLQIFKDETYENEVKAVQNLINKEEEILQLALSSVYAGKNDTMDPSLPSFFVMQSWGLLFGNKLTNISPSERHTSSKEFFFKSMEQILN